MIHVGEHFLLIDGETFFGLWLKITLLVLAINFAASVILAILGWMRRSLVSLIRWAMAARLRRLHAKGYRVARLAPPRKRPRYRYRHRELPNGWAWRWDELREAAEEILVEPTSPHARHRVERSLERLVAA
jgi:hypothetical protein